MVGLGWVRSTDPIFHAVGDSHLRRRSNTCDFKQYLAVLTGETFSRAGSLFGTIRNRSLAIRDPFEKGAAIFKMLDVCAVAK